MKIGNRESLDEPEISLTSLIDVVFTLIIFFVITTTFDSQTALQLNLPKASVDESVGSKKALVLAVDQTGSYFIDEHEVIGRDVESIEKALRQWMKGKDIANKDVTLLADESAKHQQVVVALDALGRAGFKKIAIATTLQKPEQ